MYARKWPLPLCVLCVPCFACFSALPSAELEFVELLRSPGIDSQPGDTVWKPYLMFLPDSYIGWQNRSLESNPGLLKRLQIRAQVPLIVFHLVVSIVQCLFEGKVIASSACFSPLSKIGSESYPQNDFPHWARICKRSRTPGIDSASLCSLAGRYVN